MSRELSPSEIELINRAKHYKKSTEPVKKTGKLPFFLNPVFFISLAAVVPLGITVFVMVLSFKFDDLIKSENLSITEIINAGEMEQAVNMYESRFIIIGSVWTIYVFLFVGAVLLAFLINKMRRKNDKDKV